MIRFHSVDEFLQELEKDLALVERQIVRLTAMYKQTSTAPIQHLYVVATYKAAGEIVKLETFCGQLLRLSSDTQAYERVTEGSNQIARFCTDHSLEVRAGIYE